MAASADGLSGYRDRLIRPDYSRGTLRSGTDDVLRPRRIIRRSSEALRQYDLLVTFSGTAFDLPMLLGHYPDLPLDQPHMDLCLLGRRLGYCGGLKAIERQVGIDRPETLDGMSGDGAVRSWNRWRHSRDEAARTLLLRYNEADCVNLEPLAELFYRLMVQSTRPSSTA